MKHIISILLLLVCNWGYSYAQTSPWEKAYNDLPRKERDEYYENARHFLQNYYEQITAAIEDVEIHPFITEELIDREEAETVRYKPEFIPERGKQRILTFSQYLLEASNTFRGKSEGLEFVVSNIEEDKYVHGYNALTNCFVRLDYDLEIRLHGETLLKRPCRMCCLFPEAQYKKRVRLMQIEPLEDGVIALAKTQETQHTYQTKVLTKLEKGTKEATPTNNILEEAIHFYNKEEYDKAFSMFQTLANQSVAQYYLGLCYYEGQGIAQDFFEAEKWFKKSANQGYDLALNKLEKLNYIMPPGVSVFSLYLNELTPFDKYLQAYRLYNNYKYTEAFSAFKKLAESGLDDAQCQLGECYSLGHGVKKNDKNAAYWYQKAAQGGNVTAQYKLAYCYEYGIGVDGDYTQAIEWYQKAADKKHKEAKKALRKLQKSPPCRGIIKDSDGNIIIGAAIFVKRIVSGTISDLQGYFQLEGVEPNDILQISYIGYETCIIPWQKEFMNITLIEK